MTPLKQRMVDAWRTWQPGTGTARIAGVFAVLVTIFAFGVMLRFAMSQKGRLGWELEHRAHAAGVLAGYSVEPSPGGTIDLVVTAISIRANEDAAGALQGTVRRYSLGRAGDTKELSKVIDAVSRDVGESPEMCRAGERNCAQRFMPTPEVTAVASGAMTLSFLPMGYILFFSWQLGRYSPHGALRAYVSLVRWTC